MNHPEKNIPELHKPTCEFQERKPKRHMVKKGARIYWSSMRGGDCSLRRVLRDPTKVEETTPDGRPVKPGSGKLLVKVIDDGVWYTFQKVKGGRNHRKAIEPNEKLIVLKRDARQILP
jgi:hypothetical protein